MITFHLLVPTTISSEAKLINLVEYLTIQTHYKYRCDRRFERTSQLIFLQWIPYINNGNSSRTLLHLWSESQPDHTD